MEYTKLMKLLLMAPNFYALYSGNRLENEIKLKTWKSNIKFMYTSTQLK